MELEAAREAALNASRLKSEFLANVSHEIRTPMNGVMGMTDLALQMPLPAEARRYLEVAQSSADLLLQVIDDVLDFSKVEAGRLDMHPVELDIRAEVDQLVALMGPRAEARGLDPERAHPQRRAAIVRRRSRYACARCSSTWSPTR